MSKAEDPENPEWTPEMVASAERGIDHLPAPMREAIENTRRGRGPQRAPTKMMVTLRLSRPVVAAYKATGRGWQARINADLERIAARITADKANRPTVHAGVLTRNRSVGGRVVSSHASVAGKHGVRKAAKKR